MAHKYRWKRHKPYVDDVGVCWDRDWIVRAIQWRLRWTDAIEELYWDDPLAGSEGIAFHLFAYKDSPDDQIDRALIRAYQQRDIVYHKVWEIPPSWVELAARELK